VTALDPLVVPLARIVAELAWLLEDSIDDDGEPRSAAKTLDWIAFVFEGLEPEQRGQLTGVINQLAAEAQPGARREFLESFPEAFGLIEDDEE
jgi:hypothetical protein